MSNLKLIAVAHHRNGCFGRPFYAVTFRWKDSGRTRLMAATVFYDLESEDGEVHPCNGHLAVLDAGLAAEGNVEFGVNSWRADEFEPQLRQWIAQYQLRARQELDAMADGRTPVGHA